jgi:uncharacterized membrane protein
MILPDEIADMIFGELHFYIYQGSKRFAEVRIEGENVTIEILSIPVALAAVLSHIMRKSRFSSNKLNDLKGSGYRIFIKYGKLKKEL